MCERSRKQQLSNRLSPVSPRRLTLPKIYPRYLLPLLWSSFVVFCRTIIAACGRNNRDMYLGKTLRVRHHNLPCGCTVLRVVSSQRSNDCFFAALTRRVHLVPLGL